MVQQWCVTVHQQARDGSATQTVLNMSEDASSPFALKVLTPGYLVSINPPPAGMDHRHTALPHRRRGGVSQSTTLGQNPL